MQTFVRGRYYVTVQGAERLHRELEELEIKRSEVSKNIRIAKGFGDLSENFEYHEAKREGGFIEGRLQQLKIIMPSLEVIAPEDVPADTIGFGTHVTLREEEMDEWEVLIVGPIEANPVEDRISYASPPGRGAAWPAGRRGLHRERPRRSAHL